MDKVPLAIVIPTYNEAENLPLLLEALYSLDREWQVIVVDDNSPDGTGEIAREWASRNGNLTLIQPSNRKGLGAAYKAGFAAAFKLSAPRILTMDADFSHSPQSIPGLLTALERYDVIIGSRYVPGGGIVGWGWERKVMSLGGNGLGRGVLGIKAHDCTSGFRCYRRRVVERIPVEKIRSDGYSFLIELLWLCQEAGFSIEEVPITFHDRRRGASKISWHEIYKMLFTLARLRVGGRFSAGTAMALD